MMQFNEETFRRNIGTEKKSLRFVGQDMQILKRHGVGVSHNPKANSRATLHRTSYLYYIGVKGFDQRGEVIGDPVIKRIAEAHGANEAQVTLAWLLAQSAGPGGSETP